MASRMTVVGVDDGSLPSDAPAARLLALTPDGVERLDPRPVPRRVRRRDAAVLAPGDPGLFGIRLLRAGGCRPCVPDGPVRLAAADVVTVLRGTR